MSTLREAWATFLGDAGRPLPSVKTLFVGTNLLYLCIISLLGFVAFEQLHYLYRRWKYGYAGPLFVVPLIGAIVEMVRDPETFWERQRLYAPSGASCNKIVGNFMTFLTDPDAIRKVLNDNGPEGFVMVLHPSGKRILGDNNIAFTHGPKHKALRASFLPLFGRKALGVYLQFQEHLIRTHIDKWLRATAGAAVEVRELCRELNQETSQTVFVGPYLDNPVQFSKWYYEMTEGFLSLPAYFPGTALWKAVRARENIVKVLAECAGRSKKAMLSGAEPRCLLDFWAIRVNELIAEAAADRTTPEEFTSDWAMGDSMMDFLFASQDASTASLVWSIHFMSEHPEMLARVREEQAAVNPDNGPLTYELLEKMTFARCIVKEILRIRTPPPMVPHIAMDDIKLTEKISVEKGTLVMPSTWAACMQGFPEPEKFDPDRMDPAGRAEDVKYRGNYLPFGCGPHYCVGREYAMNHLITFLAVFATSVKWERVKDGGEKRIVYLPTLYPGTCIVRMAPFQQ